MALDYPALLDELRVESATLTKLLAGLTDSDWDIDTPASGWSVRDQVTHLAYFDDTANDALRNPSRFRIDATELTKNGTDFPDRIAELYRPVTPTDLLLWFERSRTDLLATFENAGPRDRAPWYGPDMSAASSVTARLMETWAHGQDIYDALGVVHPTSPGLRSISHLGISTFAFVHTLNGREVPTSPVRVELTAPDSDEVWTWGPDDAEDRVTGPAGDFALAVTQRRHLTDTELTVTGSTARSWMTIAQAFAGAPGSGRAPTATVGTTSGGHS
ncbi:TIGR03084 family metal-binding protein [Rhodococcoides kyotonense]|uniref:TIGR03084 family protein n=1 Tax=Rhodococcoides kyotonense TaxID=398843 RepID=A0A239MZB9_9NOCA|nr:TIGR03084 family metal-binding protein [Rhodococcus kyotonensis]SNT47542.1 TIGR03084 family protein [Rhodococcus kyotonensis]